MAKTITKTKTINLGTDGVSNGVFGGAYLYDLTDTSFRLTTSSVGAYAYNNMYWYKKTLLGDSGNLVSAVIKFTFQPSSGTGHAVRLVSHNGSSTTVIETKSGLGASANAIEFNVDASSLYSTAEYYSIGFGGYKSGLSQKTWYVSNVSFTLTYTTQGYTITATAGTGGTVTGGGDYESGATATLKATPNTNYEFVKWSDGNTSATRTVTVTADKTYTATFKLKTYTLTVNAGTGGTVTGGGSYEHGATATLTATPNSGYKFVKWNDGNTEATRKVTVTGAATYTATFEKSSINNIFIGSAQPTAIGVLNNTIYFVISGTASKDTVIAESVDGYSIEVVNTMPTGATVIKEVYAETTKVYEA